MGHTNETANYYLPQFIGTDKPTWLGDVNGAMAAIDAAIANVASAATDAASVAANAATVAAGAVTTANAASETATAASTTASAASTTATTAADTANNAQSTAVSAYNKAATVGDVAELTTTAKTDAVAAINEVNAKIGDLTDLDTTAKTSVVAAINELDGEVNRGSVSVTADGVKTFSALLNELFALIDQTKITRNSTLDVAGALCVMNAYVNNGDTTSGFTYTYMHIPSNLSGYTISEYKVYASGSACRNGGIATTPAVVMTDASNDVIPASTVMTLYY